MSLIKPYNRFHRIYYSTSTFRAVCGGRLPATLYTLIADHVPIGIITVEIMLHIIQQAVVLIQVRVQVVVHTIVVAVVPAQQALYIELLEVGIVITAVVSPAHSTMIVDHVTIGNMTVEIQISHIILQVMVPIHIHAIC
jgi:hypothetical protein